MLVSLPLQEEKLFELLQNQDKLKEKINVDVKNTLNAISLSEMFLYISNLGLNAELELSDYSYEQKRDILHEYLRLETVHPINSLLITLMNCFFIVKGISYKIKNDIFTDEEYDRFISENESSIIEWMRFLDSCLLYMMHDLKDLKITDAAQYQAIEKNIPVQLISLLNYQDFTVYYSKININNLRWYSKQFEKSIYNNMRLHDILVNSTSNIVFAYLGLSAFKKKEQKDVSYNP
jgi:hypothetical protein|nr:MAG TPA_asm: hypothetical protein [Caudoviricetes sp.]